MTHSGARYAGSAALALALTIAAATAQEQAPNAGTIDQVQLGDVWADMHVHVPDYTPDVASTATAVANNANAQRLSGDVTAVITQDFDAAATGANRVTGSSAGTSIATTTAYGNAATGGTDNGYNAYHTTQTAAGTIDARTGIDMTGSNQSAGATTAIANVSVTDNNFGTNIADQTQYSAADVTAETDVDMAEGGYSATYATTAGANASSSTGYTSSNYNRALQRTETGTSVRGATDVNLTNGENVTAATNSFGNSATVNNEWGYATLGLEGAPAQQSNAADVDAASYVTLGEWSGYANASAYGVGNSALVSNIGSDTAIYAEQYNAGSIGSEAGLNGQSWTGGTGIVTSTAIGNAATASVCNYCSDSAVGGQINQTNDGAVRAYGQSTTSGAAIYGSATAIGNAATLHSVGD